ncbi:MAG: DUF4143 domain-containing protein [Usitatibacter sp.]
MGRRRFLRSAALPGYAEGCSLSPDPLPGSLPRACARRPDGIHLQPADEDDPRRGPARSRDLHFSKGGAVWHRNRLTRMVKRAKLHIGDTGVGRALLGLDASGLHTDRGRLGAMLETFVLQELRRQGSGRPDPVSFFHFRDRDDFEVDIVLERGHSAVAGVEVKAAASVNESDLRGLRKLKDAAGKDFASGVVLYDGTATIAFGDRLFAVPLRSIWEGP